MAVDEDTIEDLVTSPERVTTDEGTVKERPIGDVIKGEVYVNQKAVSGKPPHGLFLSKIRYPGTT